MKFKYNNKVYETPNLEKKLKRMKLSLEDVQIVNEKDKKEESKEYGIEGKEIRYFLHPNGMRTMCYITAGENPNPLDYFKNVMWNGSTGIKWCIQEYLEKLILI